VKAASAVVPQGLSIPAVARLAYAQLSGGLSRMREICLSGCVSSEGWHVQQELDLPG